MRKISFTEIEELLIENPVVAAIRNDNDLEAVLESKVLIVFVLYGNIMNLADICNKLKDKGKIVFVHLDLIEGLKGDHIGIEFIKKYVDPLGILTTKPSNVKHAKAIGLYAIQRVFMVDSLSLVTGIKNINDVKPNAVEVMPGIVNDIISHMVNKLNVPIIAGGLVSDKKDVMGALKSGALAISTTKRELWSL
ncbi:glycerol-3-phosphate responsive antiterminator [Clostridium sp. MSJ-4]|uniref:Glycerol-3-phosphate responsive antiterminator n=1 Tax=Clostridium simiarum TaxID=2841506 RepID=A0ABS6EY34_9CLOT|nr:MULTISPECIES: glycerol-3-phosphate responsive antiterminator [Clostridium]MBU5591135.1 glycerol-3-phosphate responsive antiterminator [Clostridium simiarum]